MSGETRGRRTPLHPANYWGPFAKDPWSPDLDPVVGPIWERAARAGRVGVDPSVDLVRLATPDDAPARAQD
jgi:hypothetical protein